jgi:peroxiredoxin
MIMTRYKVFATAGLAVLAVVSIYAGAATAAGAVAADATAVQPLAAGAAAPAFVVTRPDGRLYRFDPRHLKAPAVIIFYRGGWCPYCNAHLKSLKEAEATLRARGYEVLFLSTDRPQLLRSSLKEDTRVEAAQYTLLSDSAARASRAFGVAFHLDEATIANYKTFGVDVEVSQGNQAHILPVPAVFVINRQGRIVFAHSNPDFKVRLSAAEILAAAPADR